MTPKRSREYTEYTDLRAHIQAYGDWVRISCSYHPTFVEYLKTLVPSGDRKWDPTNRTWDVRKTFLDVLRKLLDDVGFSVTLDLNERTASRPPQESTDWVKEVFKVCPPQHYAKLYRGLASSFHPDVGGSTDLMKRINIEYQKLTGG
jgi:hypothetical protein